jgi:hypothetical protein
MTTLVSWKMGYVRCGKPKWVHGVVKKWVEGKQNVGVVGWVDNQAPTPGLTHEQRRTCMISKGMFIKSEINSHLCKWSTKKTCNWDKIEPLSSLRVGFEGKQPRVIELKCFIMWSGTKKMSILMWYYIQKDRMIILLETNDKCKSN